MNLSMTGHVSGVMKSHDVVQVRKIGGGRVDGAWVDGADERHTYDATIQQASDREIQTLTQGGERLTDVRRIWINDPIDLSLAESDQWEFEGQVWRSIKNDNRPWRDYAKIFVSRLDT